MKSKRNWHDDPDVKVSVKTFVKPALYLAPFMVGILVFTLYPFIQVVLISFEEDYKMISGSFSGIGFENYVDIFKDASFINALKNTGLYVLAVVPISTMLSILFATLLNKKIKFNGLFQTAYFMPMITSVVAVGLVWRWLFNYDYGLFNYFRSWFGLGAINWLNDPHYALISLIIYGIWSMMPFTIIIILAGLQNINPQYAVAAKVDGAKAHNIFTDITLPLLSPTISMVLIVNTISASKVFSELFPLFGGKPGPAYSLYTIIYYLYEQFYVKWKLGKAAACAMVLFIIVLIFTVIQQQLQKRWNNY